MCGKHFVNFLIFNLQYENEYEYFHPVSLPGKIMS